MNHRYHPGIPVTTGFVPAAPGWRVVSYTYNDGKIEKFVTPLAGWHINAWPHHEDGSLSEERHVEAAYWDIYDGSMEDLSMHNFSNGVRFVFGPGQDENDVDFLEMIEERLSEKLVDGKYVDSPQAFFDLWGDYLERRNAERREGKMT